MSKYKRLVTIGLTAAGIVFLGGPASASVDGIVPFQDEIRSCIAEIADHANYEDATRVQHRVFELRRRLHTFVLAIDTYVFTDISETREGA
jgi:hypothetical protein